MTEKNRIPALLPDRSYFLELLRPWKLATFGAGMLWLIYGALCYDISDWDVGISIIMGGLTYVFAPWSVITVYTAVRFRLPAWPERLLAALIPALFTVDWVYWLYHSAVGNRMLRWENFKVSMALYFVCGIVWCYPGSIKDLLGSFNTKRKNNYMKKTVRCLAAISSLLLFTAPSIHAFENTTVFNTESLEYKGGTGPKRCKERCDRRSGTNIAALQAEGWKIVNSSPKKIVAEEYRYVPCPSCEPHGCTCIGTEYTLQRDTPAPKAESRKNEFRVPETKKRPILHESEAKTSPSELDQLRMENSSLKQEITSLKQEIEMLKIRLNSQLD